MHTYIYKVCTHRQTHTHTHSCKGSLMRTSKVILDHLEILLTTVDITSRKITVNNGLHTHYTHLVLGLPPTPQKTSHFNMHPQTICSLIVAFRNRGRPRSVCFLVRVHDCTRAFTNAHTHIHTHTHTHTHTHLHMIINSQQTRP